MTTIDEMARVLRPGGAILLVDIRHLSDYELQLGQLGFDVMIKRGVGDWLWRLASCYYFSPKTLIGKKVSEEFGSHPENRAIV